MAEMGRVPSFATDESSHSAAYPLNVGNLRDTGHPAEATPPAAMAEDLPVAPGRRRLFVAKADTKPRG
jgi:hypothetical protein